VSARFTPARANRMLPLIRSIVADLVERAKELRAVAALSKDPQRDPEVRSREREVRGLLAELERLGCQYKDPGFQQGLVDFPGEIDGQPVLLCWRTDEDRITHYHGEDEGFAARRPIPDHLLGED
jgi:hypothetical protein